MFERLTLETKGRKRTRNCRLSCLSTELKEALDMAGGGGFVPLIISTMRRLIGANVSDHSVGSVIGCIDTSQSSHHSNDQH